MTLRILLSLAPLLLPLTAHADARNGAPKPSYAVLALVGDKLDIVTYQPQVGSQLDSNSHLPLPMSADELDIVALRAVNRSLHTLVEDAKVTLLAGSTSDTFAEQGRMFDGNHVTLPADIAAAVRREGATALVLLTKHRGEARLEVADGYIGSGKIEGLGFYMDTGMPMRGQDGGRSIGYLAPFVYVDLTLVDIATATVISRASITASHSIDSSNNPAGVNPWDALSSEEKVTTLKNMLAQEITDVMPKLVATQSVPSDAAKAITNPPQ